MALIAQEQHRQAILSCAKYSKPGRLQPAGFQVFSQDDEDGMIAEIFRRIGVTDRVFVECGVDDGLETNTTYLLSQGWSGFWFEGDATKCASIRAGFRRELAAGQLVLTESFLTRENIAARFASARVPTAFDLLSLDVDQNTSHLWRALGGYRPRVAVIEYNAAFPANVDWEVPYDATATWDGSLWYGASLKCVERIGAAQDMALVGCNLTGVNALFVSTEFASHFAAPFTAEHHYEPARLELLRTVGHPRGWR